MAREQSAVGGDGPGAVDHDVLAPAVEGVAVRVGEAERDVDVELLRLRLVAEDPRVRAADRRAVRRLDLGLVERPLLKIKGAAGVELEAVGGVVRVGRVEAGEDPLADVGLVVAVGVLQEHQVGRLGDQDAAVGELEAGRAMQAAGEDDLLVGLAVAVGVLEDQELVIHFLLGLPVRVGRPAGDPEAPLGVERHLHRLGQLGKLLLGGEQVDLEVLADRHLADRLLAAQEEMLTIGPGARLVGLDRDERGRVRVVDHEVLALSDGPDPLVAVGGHHVEDFHLALGDHAVGLAVGEAAGRRGRRRSSSRRPSDSG